MPNYRKATRRAARRKGINPDLFERQIGAESNFDPNAGSPAGAQGIAQFMPATARAIGVRLNDGRVSDDLEGAAALMAKYLHEYGGSWKKALTAYNAGPGRVGKPLYAETSAYIQKILGPGAEATDNPRAQAILGKLGGAAGAPDRVDVSLEPRFDQQGYEQAKKAALVGQLLARGGRQNSALFKTGVLTTQAPNREDFVSTDLRSKIVPGSPAGGGGAGTVQKASAGAARAVAEAQARLGKEEIGTTNTGPEVNRWLTRKGAPPGNPWCGAFVGVVIDKAGGRTTNRVLSVAAIEEDARARRNGFGGGFHPARQAQAGDALITAKGQHVAFVEKVDRARGIIYTIEGNTGAGRVARRQHKISEVYGVARPTYRGH